MRLLLPPSEGKTRPAAGPPLDLAALAYDGALRARRERVLAALVRLSSGRQARALDALGLSPRQAGELDANRELAGAPAAPAHEVYTGVLFEHLRLGELPAAARERVLIASALWGVVRPDDRIPAYRLSMGARLPRIPSLAAYWRPALEKALPDDGLVVDLRSSAYAAAWRPRRATVLAVRAFAEQPDGTRKVISHMAKRVRGDVGRVLLSTDETPRDPDAVLAAVRAAGLRGELGDGVLDVIE